MTAVLSVLLKAPRAGTVKTRLARELGDAAALRLHRLLAERTLAAVEVAAAGGTAAEVTVWFTPDDADAEMRAWLGPRWRYRPQGPGDLGDRLARAAAGAPPGAWWLAVGGDCPGLDADLLRQASDATEGADVVLGPTEDGGYYLVGGRAPLPDLFGGMPWSTDRLMGATRDRLRALGLRWRELPTLRDVDTAADARALGLLTTLDGGGHIGSR